MPHKRASCSGSIYEVPKFKRDCTSRKRQRRNFASEPTALAVAFVSAFCLDSPQRKQGNFFINIDRKVAKTQRKMGQYEPEASAAELFLRNATKRF